MMEWFQSMGLLEQIFALIAAPATVILFIQTIMSFFGGTANDAGLDSDVSGIGDAGAGDAGLGDAGAFEVDTELPDGHMGDSAQHFDDSGLRLFSTRGIIAFLTVGGWVGVICVESGVPGVLSVLIAAVCGFAALYGIAKLMQALMRLQESGNYDYRQGLGMRGKVYLTIPEKGTGKINLILGGSLGEFSARSGSGKAIGTGSIVRVIDLTGDVYVVEEEADS